MRPNTAALFQSLILTASVGIAHKAAAGAMPEEDAQKATMLLEALRDERFSFHAEIWHDAREIDGTQRYPAEMLLRARTQDNQLISPMAPISIISKAGLEQSFDKALILASIEQAIERKQMPISINTSAHNMVSEDFWRDISDMLQTHFDREDIYGQLTFEVTEDDLAHNPCREVLLQMKKEFGCAFAIDDFYHDREKNIGSGSGFDSFDWERLHNLKDIVDYVKIDGATVEAALQDRINFDLSGLIARILEIVPEAQIVFERVKDADQAHYLAQMGHAVQGRLLSDDREEFRDDLFRASVNFPPAPKHIKDALRKKTTTI